MSPVTAESPQTTTNAAPAAKSVTDNRPLLIAILVIVAVIAGVVLWLVLGRDSGKPKSKPENITTAIGPLGLNQTKLQARALAVGQPMWWIGPKRGVRYEFTRTTNDRIYVRYLPKGVGVGKKDGRFLIIATYPWANAYSQLKKASHNRGVAGPNGSYIWARPNDPRSVLVAFPGKNYEIEVYDPSATKAATIAESGQLHTVG